MARRLNYEDMYQMAVNQQLSGWTYWPVPSLAKKSFKLIDERLMTNREEPVFTFVARTDKNYFEENDLNAGGQQGQMNMNNMNMQNGYDQQYQQRPSILGKILAFPFKLIFGPILKPFNPKQMWTAFVLTDKNKLYFAHFSWPFSWGSDTGTMIMLPDDIRITQNNSVSDPIFGDLDILSVRGNQKMRLMWTRRTLHKIYAGISNNIEQNDRKHEDEDGNVTY